MKKSESFKKLPVVDIEEGAQIGRVRELIIHPQKRDLLALLVEDEKWWKEMKAISFPLIYGLGEYAVTVQNRQCLASLSDLPEIEKTLEMNVHPRGSKVITRSGLLLGRVVEFYLDPREGKIGAYEIHLEDSNSNESQTYILPSLYVLTLGREIVVVTDDACDHFFTSIEELMARQEEAAKKEPEPVPAFVEEKPSVRIEEVLKTSPLPEATKAGEREETKTEAVSPEKAKAVEEAPPLTAKTERETPPLEEKEEQEAPPQAPAVPKVATSPLRPADSFASQFLERVKKTLLGKTVKRDVLAPDGTVLVKAGELVTEEVLEKAASDRKLLTQLNFAVK